MYSGNVMKARSKFEGILNMKIKKLKHFVVVDGARPSLLGHDILSLIVIDWTLVNYLNVVLNSLCQKYSDVFSLGICIMKRLEEHMNLDKLGKAIFL